MSVEAVGDFGVWNWDDEDIRSSSKATSGIAMFFQSVVPSANARIFSNSSRYTVFLASTTQTNKENQEPKKHTGKWSASVGAEQDMKGTTRGDATLSIEKKVSNDLSWSADVGTVMKKEKNQEIEVGGRGRITLKGEF